MVSLINKYNNKFTGLEGTKSTKLISVVINNAITIFI